MTNPTHMVLTAACAGCLAGPGEACFPGCMSHEQPPTRHRRLLVAVGCTVAASLAVLVALCTSHYGDDTTANAGWTVSHGATTLGFETRGDPGVFAQVWTPWGEVNYFDQALTFCPAGWTDMQCGA